MKLLLFSDIHCDEAACDALIDLSAQADVVIGAGDYALFRKGLEKTIHRLGAIEVPTFLVFGNHESRKELTRACRGWQSARVLHGEGVTHNAVSFFGIGGATPVTPFGEWSVDVEEEEASRLLANAPRGGILITHSPPFNCLDLACSNQHLGSRAIRDCIRATQPALVVCGHIHETRHRRDTMGNIPVINPGPQGMLVEI